MGIEGLMKIGLAVKDADAVVKTLVESLGLEAGEMVSYQPYKMKYCMVSVGDAYLEVIQPTESEGPIARFIKAHGEGLQHLSLKVTNLEETMTVMKQRGASFLQEEPITEETSLGRAKYVFLSPRRCHGVLVQLMEITPP